MANTFLAACGIDMADSLVEPDRIDLASEIMQRAAEQAGRTVVTGCGASPGFTNVGVRHLADQLDHIRRAHVYVYQPLDAGGGEAVFRGLDVQRVQSGEPGAIAWARSSRCRAGQQWEWDGVRFEYLAPAQPAHGNNASCVLRVETADGRRFHPAFVDRSAAGSDAS
mgnify:CR=1 FL=1